MLFENYSLLRSGHFPRRAFLQGMTGGILPWLAGGGVPGMAHLLSESGRAEEKAPRLIEREKEPHNLEFPFQLLDRFIIPNDLFYVRNHFLVPKIQPRAWRLKVEGAVKKPLALSLNELHKIPSRTVTALLECAGNNRMDLKPKAKGVQWGQGAVGNAEWTGVPLAAVLERAGLGDRAVDVVLEGADKGKVGAEPLTPGVISFSRSLPLAKARKPEVLLVYKMNGVELPLEHGFPLRVVVPGWYGVASVKWLSRLVVTEKPFRGYFQTFDYSIFRRVHGLAVQVPITELEVKSAIARPRGNERIPAGEPYRIYGAAWTGESHIAKVEVSVDGGKSWAKARLQGQNANSHSWRLWHYTWLAPRKAGSYQLMSRASDTRGRVQPMQRDPDRRNYLISHVLPVSVEVG